jgi:peptidoglycan-associated lipoprotein
MKKQILVIASGILIILLVGGCTQQRAPIPDKQGGSSDSHVSLDNSGVAGGVDANGKYTGSDGLSRSGFKMLYFGYNSYRLDSGQMQRVMSDLPKIKRLVRSKNIRIEGNCDEFGTDQFNYALGLKRAKAIKALLVSNGVPAAKVTVVSYGESNPTCRGKKASCHAKNRRAEINGVH